MTVVALSNASLLLQMVGEDKRVKSWKIHTLYLCYKLMRFETSKNSYQTGQCHFPQENILHIYLLQLSTLILPIHFQTIYDRKKKRNFIHLSQTSVFVYTSQNFRPLFQMPRSLIQPDCLQKNIVLTTLNSYSVTSQQIKSTGARV